MADPRPDEPWKPDPNTFNDGGQLPTYDARNRNESVEGFMEGGGTPQAVNQYAEGGQVGGEQPDSYFLGGMLKKAKKKGSGPGLSDFYYKPTKDRPTILSKHYHKKTKDRPTVLSKYYKKK